MIDVSKRMIDIVEGIESVEDAEAAEPEIEKAMHQLTSLFTDLAENIDNVTVAELRDLQLMQYIAEDSEVKEWTEKAQAAVDRLEVEYPEAAAKLKEIGDRYGEEMAAAIMEATMEIGRKLGVDQYDSSGDFSNPDEPEFLLAYKRDLVRITDELIEEMREIDGVDDVRNAESRIAGQMEELTDALRNLVDAWNALSDEEREEMGGSAAIVENEGIVFQLERVEDELYALKERNPEAGEAFQELGKKHSAGYEELMDRLMDSDFGRDDY